MEENIPGTYSSVSSGSNKKTGLKAEIQYVVNNKIQEINGIVTDVNEMIEEINGVKDTAAEIIAMDMATKGYVTEEIVKVNTGGTVDISIKADKAYVDQKTAVFETLDALIAAYPTGLDRPAWIKSEKTWYTWETESYTSYLASAAASMSTTAYWKGSSMIVKQNIKLTEIGAAGSPTNWNIWEVAVDNKLSVKVAEGTFSNTMNNVAYYNQHILSTPVNLITGKTYILLVKYDANASYYLVGEEFGINDDFVDMVVGVYNRVDLPIIGLAVSTVPASQFVYKHYLKYEK